MNLNKRILIGTLGATAIGAGLGGKKGLEAGLGLGLKIGFVTGVTAGVVSSTILVLGKNKIKEKCLVTEE